MLRVIGKRQKEREVLVPGEAVNELASDLVSRGLDADRERATQILGHASVATTSVYVTAE